MPNQKRLPKIVKRSLEERVLPDGRRTIKLRQGERLALQRDSQVESAVAMFLDLDNEYSDIFEFFDRYAHKFTSE